MSTTQDLQTAIERIRSDPFPDNERAVEIKVILPLLSALGWGVHGAEVRYQYKVSGTRSRSQGVVDIAMFGARGALCFIEAKNTDERLDNYVSQLLGYAFYEGVVLCALTNGREWWLYLPREGGKPETRKFAQLNLEADTPDGLAEQMQLFLAKNNLESGRAEKLARQRLSEKRERGIWQEMLTKPDRALVKTIADRIEKDTGERPPQSRVAALLADTQFDMEIRVSDAAATKATQNEVAISPADLATEAAARPKREKTPSTRVKGVRLWGDFKEASTWVTAYISLANELYKKHPDEFLERANSLFNKGKYPWFSLQKEACSTSYSEARTLEDSRPTIFAYINISANGLRKRSRQLLEIFGYSDDDANIWEIITE